MKLEDLNLTKSCLKELKRSGFREVEEVVEFLKNIAENPTVMLRMSSECLDETIDKLVTLGFLSKERWGNLSE